MTAQAIANVVIFTICICLPEIQPGIGQRLAILIQYITDEDETCTCHPFLQQGMFFRTIWCVIRTFGLGLCQCITNWRRKRDSILSEKIIAGTGVAEAAA